MSITTDQDDRRRPNTWICPHEHDVIEPDRVGYVPACPHCGHVA
jgi:hypothetical protein